MKIGPRILSYLVPIIYLSFALDSLLKIDFGIKIHLGILLIFFINLLHLFSFKNKTRLKFDKMDFWLILFGIYIFFNGILKFGVDSLFIYLYFFLALNVYFFIQRNLQYLTIRVITNFQYILIVTGLMQVLLVFLLDYQINFLGTDLYNKGSSVTLRMRGFFVEPNWFAIALTFNTFLLIKNDILKFIKEQPLLVFGTGLALLLNGSFGTLIILVLTYGYRYFKKNIVIGIVVFLIGVGGSYWMLQKRAQFKKGKTGLELFNYYSRTEPFKRTNQYFQSNNETASIWYGEGLGSWGTKGISNRLSVLTFEPKRFSRDSSELHVFLFELGIFGILLFMLDVLSLYKNNARGNIYLNGAIALFLVSFLLYPIFKFMMYMVYYFLVRAIIKNNKKGRIINVGGNA